jgi:hypothetical protein
MADPCAICMESVETEAYAFECGHTFHATCLVGWLRQGNLSCPTCRADVGEHLDAMTLRERAKYLRTTVARRKSCPAELRSLVASVRRAEEAEREATRECTEHHRAHADVFKTHNRLRARKWTAKRRARDKMRALGAYASPQCPLPGLVVHNVTL